MIIKYFKQMVFYYFDIQTTGLNPDQDEIICIAFQEIDLVTGKVFGELKVLKSWESSEREIVKSWFNICRIRRFNWSII